MSSILSTATISTATISTATISKATMIPTAPIDPTEARIPKRARSLGQLLLVGLAVLLPTLPATAQLGVFQQWLDGGSADARHGEALTFCDFDGDGREDLAAGTPDQTLNFMGSSLSSAGVVRVYFGTEDGVALPSGDSQVLRQSLLTGSEDGAGHRFGAALASADFNLDGACDLAVGIPGAPVDGLVAAGRVAVIYGRVGDTLDTDDIAFFDLSVLTGSPRTGDRFGSVLAAGPVGEDTYPDLAVGVPEAQVGVHDGAGTVHLISSRNAGGLSTIVEARLHQDVLDMFGVAAPDDHFGAAIVIGDGTGDGVPDLIVSSPGDGVSNGLTNVAAGAVQVIPGGESGVDIDPMGQQFWTQRTDDVLGTAEAGDAFGAALALGDFDGDGRPDLAVGVPGESQFGPNESGAVQVFYGTVNGLSATNNQVLLESLISPEIATFDRFGSALAAADFNGDGFDELAVGYALDNVLGVVNAGNVAVLRGDGSGLLTTGAQLWNGFSSTELTLEPGSELGFALAAGRFGGARYGTYLAVGVPGQPDGADPQAGGVLLIGGQDLIFADGFETGNLLAWQQIAMREATPP